MAVPPIVTRWWRSLGGVGGSGVTVDNTVDPPVAVTTLVASGAAITGSEATLRSVYFGADNPGAVGAGSLWVYFSEAIYDHGNYLQLYVRDENDASWLAVGAADTEASGGTTGLLALGSAPDPWYARSSVVVAGGGSGSITLTVKDTSDAEAGSLFIGQTVMGLNHAVELALNPVKIRLPNIPTSNPGVAGQLWNDAGTLKVSAG